MLGEARSQANIIVRKRTEQGRRNALGHFRRPAENGGKLPFRPSGTPHADSPATGNVVFSNGSKTMAKLESFAFSLGLMLSSVLMFATLAPLA